MNPTNSKTHIKVVVTFIQENDDGPDGSNAKDNGTSGLTERTITGLGNNIKDAWKDVEKQIALIMKEQKVGIKHRRTLLNSKHR